MLKHDTKRSTTIMLFGLLLIGALAPARVAAQMHSGSDADIEAYIERTGEILMRAADFVADAPNPRSIRILEEARHSHRRSQEYMMGGQGRMAFAHSQRARDGAQQAARIARELAGDMERLQRRLERYLELRERVGERVRESGDERAMRFLTESEQQARRARDLQQQGDVALGLQVLHGAEDMLGRAARLAFEGAGNGRMERELERTRLYLERVSGEVGPDPEAQEMLTSARMALGRAEDAAGRGQVIRALNSLQLAQRLASRAAAGDEQLDAEQVRHQLERFEERLARVRDEIGDGPGDGARQALERAEVHRERARQMLDQGKLEAAMRQIKAGFDLLAAAHETGG